MAPTSSASKTNQHRYLIAYLLDSLEIGDKFQPSALHITILPWFALETDEGPFLTWFYDHFDRVPAFNAEVGTRKLFGPDKDVPVSLMEPERKFMQLHLLALSWFGKVGARWAEKDPYVGNDYIPHVAQRRGFVLNEGDILPISSLTLFKAARREDQIRRVAAKAVLKQG
ncbi:hypothetical protein HYW35_03695 [Candidatus Saccharibacteria bacterium]|nr:hypothetical protein [Candidatus Saccharibacteria bacterium]